MDFFDELGHVLSESFHRLDAFRIVLNFSRVSTDGHIPVTGAWDDHLVDREKIVH